MLVELNSRTRELKKWLALSILAAALALLAANGTMAGPMQPPGELPAETDTTSVPLHGQYDDRATEFDSALDLMMTLQQHQQGDMEEAIKGWRRSNLPCQTEVWRQVGLAAAYLRIGALPQAADALEVAETMYPDHAVVHYEKAILYLMSAETARDWHDSVGPTLTRFANYTKVSPKPKAFYQLAAIAEFEAAITLADQVDPMQPLLTVPWVVEQPHHRTMAICTPLVGDLLAAIGADNFAGKAHNMLGPLYLERGSLEQAEEHMDAAVELGMDVLDGYQDLAVQYEVQGKHRDAFRAYLKAAGKGGPVAPTFKAIESLRKGILDL